MWWHLDHLPAVLLKLSRLSGKWDAALVLEAILVKWHPSELFVETKACCELEETESQEWHFWPWA